MWRYRETLIDVDALQMSMKKLGEDVSILV